MNETKTKKICSLETAKKLRALMFNLICDYMYCTDVRHKGKHIDYETELDLKFEGKESEIEEVPFGQLMSMTNFNVENGPNACSAPFLNDAVDWLRDHYNVVIYNEPFYIDMSQSTLYTPRVMFLTGGMFHQKYEDMNYMNEIDGEDYWEVLDKAVSKACDMISEQKSRKKNKQN